MGHEVFSMGAYQTANADNGVRPAIPGLYQNDHLKGASIRCNKENIGEELIEWADIIITMHNSRVDIKDHPQPWIHRNWEKMKHKPVIWRSIGQSTREIEKSIEAYRKKGLKIVRYSPREESIPSYQGSDALIRFYKDPDEYKDYNGQIARIVNISQALFGGKEVKSRGDHMNLDVFKQVVDGLPWKVFGPDNGNAGEEYDGGVMGFEDLKSMLRFNRVYLYFGTRPASYTLAFIEAMMTGIPIVSVGPVYGNSIYTDQKTFEVHDIIGESGTAGFWSDNPEELKSFCKQLLDDPDLAMKVGAAGRIKAISLFGKDKIAAEWDALFKTL